VPLDSGLACLLMMARLHGVAADAQQLWREHSADGAAFGRTEILLAAKSLGLHANCPTGAGMSVSVEIKTGKRRIIEYVLSPFLQHQRESLNER